MREKPTDNRENVHQPNAGVTSDTGDEDRWGVTFDTVDEDRWATALSALSESSARLFLAHIEAALAAEPFAADDLDATDVEVATDDASNQVGGLPQRVRDVFVTIADLPGSSSPARASGEVIQLTALRNPPRRHPPMAFAAEDEVDEPAGLNVPDESGGAVPDVLFENTARGPDVFCDVEGALYLRRDQYEGTMVWLGTEQASLDISRHNGFVRVVGWGSGRLQRAVADAVRHLG